MVNWQKRYEEGETPWEKGAAAPPLRAFLRHNPVRGKVLAPGCGLGHDVRLLSRHGAELTGLEVAPLAVERARRFPAENGEVYRVGDFLDLPDSLRSQFDWIYENTCFCAIDPQDRTRYAASAAGALKPGGKLLGIFYPHTGNPPGEGPPFPCTPEELDTLFGRDGFRVVARWIPQVGFPGRVGNEEFRILEKA